MRAVIRVLFLSPLFALLLVGGTRTACAEEADEKGHALRLEPGMPGSLLEPRFSAPATETALKGIEKGSMQGHDHLQGHLRLGPRPGDGRPFVLMRTRSDQPYDLLLLDINGDGSLEGDRPLRTKKRESGGSIWSTFEVELRVDHGAPGKPSFEPFAIGLWVVVESKDATPALLYHTAHGYRAGQVILEEATCNVVLSDGNNDGVYGTGDTWTLRPAAEKGDYEYVASRKVGDFAWARGRAWKLELEGTTGRACRVVPFDPGISQEADEKKRDPCWEDRRAPRAKVPLVFAVDVDAGLADARQRLAPFFLNFETGQCLACDDMNKMVYSAASVVEAAKGLVCIRVDGKQRKTLKERFAVESYPTGILFDPAGSELARFTGYRSGQQFLQFLGEANPFLRPADVEPRLKGKAKKRNAAEVKRIFDYLQDRKQHGLLTDRIGDVGSRKTRAARDALIRFATKRKSKEYIAAAFDALARIGGKTSIEFLCGKKALGSGDFLVAQGAARALAEAKDPAATGPILAVMTNRRTKIEIVAACALALAKSAPEDERVQQAVFKYSEHGKDTIRAGAAEALGYLKSEEAVSRLKSLLTGDKNTRVRAAAATGIGWTGRTDLIPFLRQAIDGDKAHTVRTEALAAIRYLQGKAEEK